WCESLMSSQACSPVVLPSFPTRRSSDLPWCRPVPRRYLWPRRGGRAADNLGTLELLASERGADSRVCVAAQTGQQISRPIRGRGGVTVLRPPQSFPAVRISRHGHFDGRVNFARILFRNATCRRRSRDLRGHS